MRMGSSSLSSESWVPRLGWLFSSTAASPAGSDLLQPPDVSSVASGSAISVAAEAVDPPSNTLSAEAETEEVLEQEASHGASATEAGSLRCPEDSEGAEGKSKELIHHISHVQVNRGFASLEINLSHQAHLAVRLNSPGSVQPLPGLLWDGRRPEDRKGCCSCGERRSHLCQSLQTCFRAVFFLILNKSSVLGLHKKTKKTNK